MFEDSTYLVRARLPGIEWILRSLSTYRIDSVPASSTSRFSFSWGTRGIRREPDGPDLLSLASGERHGWLSNRSYDVREAARDAPIGSFAPRGSDWRLFDASGNTVGDVVRLHAGYARAKYVTRIDSDEVCTLEWRFAGLSVFSAELQIDFQPGAEARVQKALVLALAPIIEERARLTSLWHSS